MIIAVVLRNVRNVNTFDDYILYMLLLLLFFFFRKTLGVLALGQILSWLLCGTGIFSQLLQTNYDIQAPTAQSFLNYLLLGFVYTSQFACQTENFKETLKNRGWKYLILSLIDVEANFLVVKAYQYTNLTSIQVRQSVHERRDWMIILVCGIFRQHSWQWQLLHDMYQLTAVLPG